MINRGIILIILSVIMVMSFSMPGYAAVSGSINPSKASCTQTVIKESTGRTSEYVVRVSCSEKNYNVKKNMGDTTPANKRDKLSAPQKYGKPVTKKTKLLDLGFMKWINFQIVLPRFITRMNASFVYIMTH